VAFAISAGEPRSTKKPIAGVSPLKKPAGTRASAADSARRNFVWTPFSCPTMRRTIDNRSIGALMILGGIAIASRRWPSRRMRTAQGYHLEA